MIVGVNRQRVIRGHLRRPAAVAARPRCTPSREVLRSAAASVDLDGKIPQSHFEALRSGGFYGLAFATGNPVTALSDVGEILN